MIYCVTVQRAHEKRHSLVCIFSDEIRAALWISRVDIVKRDGRWHVRTPSMSSLLPRKIVRWVFDSKEEAEAFVKGFKIEEKRKWEAWIH
jgi:hypothetical protein